MGKQSFNRLTIATLPLLGIYVLPRIVPDFAEQFPSVDQKIVECSSAEILKQLDHDDVDLVLTNLRPDNPHLRYERSWADLWCWLRSMKTNAAVLSLTAATIWNTHSR